MPFIQEFRSRHNLRFVFGEETCGTSAGALSKKNADIENVIEKMHALRGLGVRFSIDDFGTGYSSLSYLKRLPISQLTIDRSSVADLPGNRNDVAIIDTIIAMARHLGMNVLAEGVETATQLDALRTRACGIYQGYQLSRPLPAKDFYHLLRFGHQASHVGNSFDRLDRRTD